jgi:hypothetical protein
MRRCLVLFGTLAAASVMNASGALAVEYPWCLYYSGGGMDGGGTNCGFTTFDQCLATASGAGGFCNENPRYSAPTYNPVPHKKPRRH